MSEEKLGVQNIEEILVASNEIGLVVAKHAKDGLQLAKDVPSIVAEVLASDALKGALSKAVEGAGSVIAEGKDISVAEAVQLVGVQVAYVPKYLEVLKG